MTVNKNEGSFPDMDVLLGGSRRPTLPTTEPAPQPEPSDDPRGKLERTSLQLYTKQRDKAGAMAFFKRVNNYDILAEALDEYFENHKDELAEAMELQQKSVRPRRGRPRRT